MMKLRNVGAALLWSRGNDGALLLIAVWAWFNAFGGPTGKFPNADRIWLSLSFWVGVGAMVLALIVIYGRWRYATGSQWLGAGERVARVPSLADSPGSYEWWSEVSPRRPLISTEDDASEQMLIAACTACVIGSLAGYASCAPTEKDVLFITLLSGFCFALAGAAYAWTTYGAKGKHLVWVKSFRQAYLTPSANGGGLDFIVVSKLSQASPGGVVLVRMPWSAVNVFDSGSYWRSFGLSIQSEHDDWNVIKMTPQVGKPVLITETYAGEARLYDLVSSLTERFGPAARAAFERKTGQRADQRSATISPVQKSAAYWAGVKSQPVVYGKIRLAAFKAFPFLREKSDLKLEAISKPGVVDQLLARVPEIDRSMRRYLRIQLSWPHPCIGGAERFAEAHVHMYPLGEPNGGAGEHEGDAIEIMIFARSEVRHWTKQLSQLTTFAIHLARDVPVPATYLYSDDTVLSEEAHLFALEFADGEMIPIAHLRRGDARTIAMLVTWSKVLEAARVEALQASATRTSSNVPTSFE